MMREVPLSLRQKYLNVVSKLVTPGALGVAVLLGSTAPIAASQEPAALQPPGAQGERVSERLAAGGGWGWGRPWGNFGFGGGSPWSNWNNWRNGWNNWGNGWGNW